MNDLRRYFRKKYNGFKSFLFCYKKEIFIIFFLIFVLLFFLLIYLYKIKINQRNRVFAVDLDLNNVPLPFKNDVVTKQNRLILIFYFAGFFTALLLLKYSLGFNFKLHFPKMWKKELEPEPKGEESFFTLTFDTVLYYIITPNAFVLLIYKNFECLFNNTLQLPLLVRYCWLSFKIQMFTFRNEIFRLFYRFFIPSRGSSVMGDRVRGLYFYFLDLLGLM